MWQTEFEFTLPKGYLDSDGNVHRIGIMRLAKAIDEIVPLRDPRVKLNPAYATVIILSRVVTRLGALDEINPVIIENLYAGDLDYLINFYRNINDLEENNLSAEKRRMISSNIPPTEFNFTLPKGLIDEEGNIHRQGIMRLATAKDEIVVQKNTRAQTEPIYSVLVRLSRVITLLGTLSSVTPEILENLFTVDLAYLREFYNRINQQNHAYFGVQCPQCNHDFRVDLALSGVISYPSEQLREEVAYLAFHFHWSLENILNLEHSSRREWVREIKRISKTRETEI